MQITKEEYFQNFIQAGALAREVRAYGKSLIVSGASYNDVRNKINQKILALGAIAAFPPQIALNDVAAHFLTWPGQDIIFSDEVIKLDVGVCFKGAIGDCAVTIDLSDQYKDLVKAVEAALLAAEQSIYVGQKISEIGKIIEKTIHSYHYKPVKNLCGHGLGYYQIHTSPSIPNYHDRSKGEVVPGMTFAIEPFATNGHGLIYEANQPTIFSFQKECKVRSEFARLILDRIKTFQNLPFAIHDLLSKEFPLVIVEVALDELLKVGAIAGYPPLMEQGKGVVAQAENSVYVDYKGKVYITTR